MKKFTAGAVAAAVLLVGCGGESSSQAARRACKRYGGVSRHAVIHKLPGKRIQVRCRSGGVTAITKRRGS